MSKMSNKLMHWISLLSETVYKTFNLSKGIEFSVVVHDVWPGLDLIPFSKWYIDSRKMHYFFTCFGNNSVGEITLYHFYFIYWFFFILINFVSFVCFSPLPWQFIANRIMIYIDNHKKQLVISQGYKFSWFEEK
jgi:hypothetical protein